MEDYRLAAEVTEAVEECLTALIDDADLDVGVFFGSWAQKHDIPQDQQDDFINHARRHLATEVAVSRLADRAITTPDIMPPGIDSEEYTSRRRYSLHSEVSAMFERRKPEAWTEPRPTEENSGTDSGD